MTIFQGQRGFSEGNFRAYLDSNSNYTRDSDEPFISGGSVTINAIQQTISSAGATFYLPTGVYPVAFTPPAGYASVWSPPHSVLVNNAAQTLSFPLRVAGGGSNPLLTDLTGFLKPVRSTGDSSCLL